MIMTHVERTRRCGQTGVLWSAARRWQRGLESTAGFSVWWRATRQYRYTKAGLSWKRLGMPMGPKVNFSSPYSAYCSSVPALHMCSPYTYALIVVTYMGTLYNFKFPALNPMVLEGKSCRKITEIPQGPRKVRLLLHYCKNLWNLNFIDIFKKTF